MGRAPCCCSKVGMHRGPWTPREDALLTNYIQAHGEGIWRSLPKRAGLLRCGKSCRLRWMNYLRPDIKRGNITAEEDDLIIRMHSLLGNKWSLIAGRIPGRMDNEIKNYWNTHLSKSKSKRLLIKNNQEATDHQKPAAAAGKKKNNKNKKKGTKLEEYYYYSSSGKGMDEKSSLVYLPKPIRVTTMALSSCILPLSRNDGTLTLESNTNNNNASTTKRSQEKNEDEVNGNNDDGFGIFEVAGYDDDFDLVNKYHRDHSGFPMLDKMYEEYLQLLS